MTGYMEMNAKPVVKRDGQVILNGRRIGWVTRDIGDRWAATRNGFVVVRHRHTRSECVKALVSKVTR